MKTPTHTWQTALQGAQHLDKINYVEERKTIHVHFANYIYFVELWKNNECTNYMFEKTEDYIAFMAAAS